MANGELLNAEEVLDRFEAVLDRRIDGPCCLDTYRLWDQLIETGGYVQTPESAVPEDQIFTIYVGFDAVERTGSFNEMVYDNFVRRLDRTIDESLLEVETNPATASWL